MTVEEFADVAFAAKSMPSFGYGCAVFMQSDIVNFQRHGWRSEEILAGLADVLHTPLVNLTGSNACPTVTATPEVVKAAFLKKSDIFGENGITYLDPILNLQDEKICADRMYKAWSPLLGLSHGENDRAIAAGFEALSDSESDIRRQARETLDQLEREDRIGIVMLGRVYHHVQG